MIIDKKIEELIEDFSYKLNIQFSTKEENIIGKFFTKLINPAVEKARIGKMISLDLDFDTEYDLSKFRRIQSEYFDEDGKSYKANIISHNIMELMLKIIDGFDKYVKSH